MSEPRRRSSESCKVGCVDFAARGGRKVSACIILPLRTRRGCRSRPSYALAYLAGITALACTQLALETRLAACIGSQWRGGASVRAPWSLVAGRSLVLRGTTLCVRRRQQRAAGTQVSAMSALTHRLTGALRWALTVCDHKRNLDSLFGPELAVAGGCVEL